MARNSLSGKTFGRTHLPASTHARDSEVRIADQRTALEFSRILQRLSDTESGLEHRREQSTSETIVNNRQSPAESAAPGPELFLREGASFVSRRELDQVDSTPATSDCSISAIAPTDVVNVSLSEQATNLKAESLVEVVYKNWMAANTTASTRNWKVEIFIGTNVRTEIDIEYTPNGEWRVSINSEPEYRSEEQNNSEGISDSMTQSALNSQQFCRELEAKLKTNQSPLDSPKT